MSCTTNEVSPLDQLVKLLCFRVLDQSVTIRRSLRGVCGWLSTRLRMTKDPQHTPVLNLINKKTMLFDILTQPELSTTHKQSCPALPTIVRIWLTVPDSQQHPGMTRTLFLAAHDHENTKSHTIPLTYLVSVCIEILFLY